MDDKQVIQRKDTDEVWLAMVNAKAALIQDGHTASQYAKGCASCRAVYLLDKGMEAYVRRIHAAEQSHGD